MPVPFKSIFRSFLSELNRVINTWGKKIIFFRPSNSCVIFIAAGLFSESWSCLVYIFRDVCWTIWPYSACFVCKWMNECAINNCMEFEKERFYNNNTRHNGFYFCLSSLTYKSLQFTIIWHHFHSQIAKDWKDLKRKKNNKIKRFLLWRNFCCPLYLLLLLLLHYL